MDDFGAFLLVVLVWWIFMMVMIGVISATDNPYCPAGWQTVYTDSVLTGCIAPGLPANVAPGQITPPIAGEND